MMGKEANEQMKKVRKRSQGSEEEYVRETEKTQIKNEDLKIKARKTKKATT